MVQQHAMLLSCVMDGEGCTLPRGYLIGVIHSPAMREKQERNKGSSIEKKEQ